MVILLIEDEYKLSKVLQKGFESEHFIVDIAYDGDEGLKKALQHEYDVIILDVVLLKKNGFEICQELRRRGTETPIIIFQLV